MTICSNNYFPYARVLFSSLKRYHPESSLFLCLADISSPDLEFGISGVEIIEAQKLGIPNFLDFAFRYDIMEFNTAIKPFMMSYLIEELGFEQVVYLDPDIEVFAPMDRVFGALGAGANFVLTPHITAPAEEDDYYPDDIGVMKAGIYNLGFIAVSNNSDVVKFLHWWGRRLRFQCVNQQDQGIFVDQKFVDLLPGFHDNVKILRDPNLNVAYWNLWQRQLDENTEGWLINDQPLVFFHFSGISTNQPFRLSKHTVRFSDNLKPALQSLIDHYISQLKIFAIKSSPCAYYAYGKFDNGVPITNFIRYCYRSLEDSWLNNPFTEFLDHLNEPFWRASALSAYPLTNLMYYLWKQQEGLQTSFNLESLEGRKNYALWFIKHSEDIGIDPYFLDPILDQISRVQSSSLKTQAINQSKKKQPNVSVIGYLRSTTGVGNAGRMVIRGLEAAKIEPNGFNVTLNVETRQNDNSVDDLLSPIADGKVHIYNVNADQLSLVKKSIQKFTQPPEYIINMPFWELSKFPTEWLSSYEGINEIWAPTRFVQRTIQSVINLPVFWMPPAVTIGKFPLVDRKHFNLPENTFLFHFNFDLSSFSTRKNPMAVIEAYHLAFRSHHSSAKTGLVIKTRGQDTDDSNLKNLMNSTAEESDIFVLNQSMSYDDTLSLMNCCDCYVSLHRSEGFGYTLAEAMLLEKPVIATDYSGSKDFIDSSTGFPVQYQLKSLNEGDYPFWEGQKWADPDIDHAAWLMQQIVSDQFKTKAVAEAGKNKILTDYSLEYLGNKYRERLQKIGI